MAASCAPLSVARTRTSTMTTAFAHVEPICVIYRDRETTHHNYTYQLDPSLGSCTLASLSIRILFRRDSGVP